MMTSYPILNKKQVAAVRAAFKKHRKWENLYLFWDGHIEGVEELGHKLTSRAACLISVQTDGFPAIVGRGHHQINMNRGTIDNPVKARLGPDPDKSHKPGTYERSWCNILTLLFNGRAEAERAWGKIRKPLYDMGNMQGLTSVVSGSGLSIYYPHEATTARAIIVLIDALGIKCEFWSHIEGTYKNYT